MVVARLARALIVRPDLWPAAAAAAWSLAPRGWWRRRPFLPLPDRRWIEFRLATAYGAQGQLRADDLVAWLDWRRRFPG
jgi:hypothetical protein